jgi:hypothetical protein
MVVAAANVGTESTVKTSGSRVCLLFIENFPPKAPKTVKITNTTFVPSLSH